MSYIGKSGSGIFISVVFVKAMFNVPLILLYKVRQVSEKLIKYSIRATDE